MAEQLCAICGAWFCLCDGEKTPTVDARRNFEPVLVWVEDGKRRYTAVVMRWQAEAQGLELFKG